MLRFHHNNPHSTFEKYGLVQFFISVLGITISTSFQLVFTYFLPCHYSRPQPFYLSPECQESGHAVIQSAMQNSCLASRNLNNKEDNKTAVTASTAGDPNSTNQKHGTKLLGTDEGRFTHKDEQLFFPVLLGNL